MGRHVFFSFHYQRDIWRVNQVRNSWVTQENTTASFWDDASWESVKRQGDQAIKNWINRQMKGTSVTVVLIGAETSTRKYVKYETQRSYQEGKGILGIRIHKLENQYGYTDHQGQNPLDILTVNNNGRNTPLSHLHNGYDHIYKTYDWILNNGYHNIGNWIEEAARNAGRLNYNPSLNY